MTKTILLADDSVTIRKVIELTFSDTEIRVETVGSGREALERMATLQPDMVIADVVMPAPTGYEICRAVKADRPNVPVLLLAGSFEPFDQTLADNCGADGHLVKPFDSQTLIDRVRGLLAPQPAEPAVPERPLLTPVPEPVAQRPEEAGEETGFALTEAVEVTGSQLGVEPLPHPRQAAHGAEIHDTDEIEEVMDDLASSESPTVDDTPGFATPVQVTPPAQPASYVVEAQLDDEDHPVDDEAEEANESHPSTQPNTAARAERSLSGLTLSDADIEAIAMAVVSRLSEEICREIAWEVVPDLAEAIIRERILELERESEG